MEVEKALKRLREVMARRGHSRLWSSVIKSLNEELKAGSKSSLAVLSVAREDDVKTYQKLAKGAQVRVDPSLIGGYVLTENNRRTDQSYKSRLLNWYRASIKS